MPSALRRAFRDALVRRRAPRAVGQVVQVDEPGVQPVLVGVLGGQRRLDLLVLDDAAGRRVGQEDAAGLQPPLPDHRGRAESMSSTPTSLASTTRPSLVTQYRPGRRPLRSSTAPITEPSVNAISAGPSHGSISAAWYR